MCHELSPVTHVMYRILDNEDHGLLGRDLPKAVLCASAKFIKHIESYHWLTQCSAE